MTVMTEPLLGQINVWSESEPPKGWVFADGQLMIVAAHQSLFGLMGYSFGGEGGTFALPNLNRFPLPDGRRYVVAVKGVRPGA